MKRIFTKNKIRLGLSMPYLRYRVVLSGLVVVLSSCSVMPQYKYNDAANNNDTSKYNVHSLAKDWREQVRKNPYNPYEGAAYPADNDSEYYYPAKKPRHKHNNPNSTAGAIDNDSDSSYGRFPRYNPDDDNLYLDPKQYPLYLDYGG